MLETVEALLEKIRLGEDSTLELKEVRVAAPHRDGLADELAAFANARGGVCVLGVEDKARQLIGIPLECLDAVENFVQAICNDSIEPPLLVNIEKLMLPEGSGTGVPVLKIEVPKSLFVHKSPGGFLHRVGSSKREMTTEHLARLFQQRSQARIVRFDEQIVPRTTLSDLAEPLWNRFRTSYSSAEAKEPLLDKLGLARADVDGILRPTVAGILLATEEPTRFLSSAFIQAVAYSGHSAGAVVADEAYQLDAMDVSGPLDRQIADAWRFVIRNMRTAATKSIGRRDYPQYDLTAVFEALVNAVAHRDYAVYGSKIRLRMYDDRLEIASPGALPNTMTVESIALRQAARNEVLTSLLARCPLPSSLEKLETDRRAFMDKRGEGVGIILQRSLELSGRRPEYRMVDDAELILTIWAATPPKVAAVQDRSQ